MFLLTAVAVQVSSISFYEHHVFRGDRSGTQVAPEAVQRQCILQAEVTNRTDSSLQVHNLAASFHVQVSLAFCVRLSLGGRSGLD